MKNKENKENRKKIFTKNDIYLTNSKHVAFHINKDIDYWELILNLHNSLLNQTWK